MTELIGRTFGSYQIVEQIGLGGMATVYKAYQASMDRFVAIKVLPRQLAEDPTYLGRFEQEARTIARLENKHILPVYDFGEQDGYTYLVMRYVGAGTLKHFTQRGPLPLADAVDFLAQIADALDYAHAHGVIHRDVKTSNVLIDEARQCYLTDFGIAKLTAGTQQFTGSGTIVGTPAYMSPEQCSGLPLDARSDIYSLGIVLYEMLTGAVPFEAETPLAVVLMHVRDPLPSPRSFNPRLPESVEQVVFRALAKQPDQRYQAARDLAEALRAAVSGAATQAAAVPAAPRGVGAAIEGPTVALPGTRPGAPAIPVRRAARRGRLFAAGLALVALAAAAIVALVVMVGGDSDGGGPEDAGSVGALGEAAWQVFSTSRGDSEEDRQLVITPGALWMSSGGGLVRWTRDGGYTRYTAADGLAFNDIQTLALDGSGNLWLAGGGNQAGVMRLRLTPASEIAAIDYYTPVNSPLRSDSVSALLALPDGTLLAGTYAGSYVDWWAGEAWHIPAFVTGDLTVIGDRVNALARTPDGTLWAGGPLGLARLSGEHWEPVALPPGLPAADQYNILSLYADPVDGALWVGVMTEPGWETAVLRGLSSESGLDWTPVDERIPGDAFTILRAADGALWFVMPYVGVARLAPSGGIQTFDAEQGISGERYYDVAEDADGTIWVTTDAALARFDGARWTSFAGGVAGEPPRHDVSGMAETGSARWFYTRYGGLFHYTGGAWQEDAFLDMEVFDIAAQGAVIWLASAEGLIRWEDGLSRRFTAEDGLVDSSITALAVDPADSARLWVGTRRGLTLFDTGELRAVQSWSREQDGFPGPVISRLYIDRRGVLWVGAAFDENTPGAAALLRRTGEGGWETVASLDASEGAYGEWVWSMADDGAGGLWVGTNQALYRWDGAAWKPQTDGVPDSVGIVGIAVLGADDVLVATEYYGLYRASRAGWRHLDRQWTGTNFLYAMQWASDGALWIFTRDGMVRLERAAWEAP